ncbi:MAG: hypothetical protein IKA48_08035, partial [Fibrobacter sp.]|nr:hypothetical protein [Fibrobacter sp.]
RIRANSTLNSRLRFYATGYVNNNLNKNEHNNMQILHITRLFPYSGHQGFLDGPPNLCKNCTGSNPGRRLRAR